MLNPSEADRKPNEPVEFGNHDLARLYARETIGYAHFAQQEPDPMGFLRELSDAVDGENGGQIATRIIFDFEESGDLFTMAVSREQRVVSFDSEGVRQELSIQLRSFLDLDEEERKRYLTELQKEKEKARIEYDTSGY